MCKDLFSIWWKWKHWDSQSHGRTLLLRIRTRNGANKIISGSLIQGMMMPLAAKGTLQLSWFRYLCIWWCLQRNGQAPSSIHPLWGAPEVCKAQLLQLPRIYRLEDLFSRNSSAGNRLGLSYELLNPSIYHITAPNHSVNAGRKCATGTKVLQCLSFDTPRKQQGNKFQALGSIKTFQREPSKWKPIIKIIIIRGTICFQSNHAK